MMYRVTIIKNDGTQKSGTVEEPNFHELMKGLDDDMISFVVSKTK